MSKIEPKTRLEFFLDKIAGNSASKDLKPKTRFEKWLYKISGEEIAQAPKTRLEHFLNEIANRPDTGSHYVIVISERPFSANNQAADGVYTALLGGTIFSGDQIIVRFDGHDYECTRNTDGTYGATRSGDTVDFSDYPFILNPDPYDTVIAVGDNLNHSIMVKEQRDADTIMATVPMYFAAEEGEQVEINMPRIENAMVYGGTATLKAKVHESFLVPLSKNGAIISTSPEYRLDPGIPAQPDMSDAEKIDDHTVRIIRDSVHGITIYPVE